MPLVYDDIPGSWGDYSRDWPFIRFDTEEEHNEARMLIVKKKVNIPYGSYVSMANGYKGTDGWVLRLETQEYVTMLRTALGGYRA